MPKVSIVIPIYKVEKFLRQCLDSVINQTLEDIEIILVDDGSPDSCPQICDEYAAKDSRIKVIHKENGGYGTACNRGIEEATGDYIGLVESDDWIEPDMYEKLYNQITKFDADVCISSFYEYKANSVFQNGSHDNPYLEVIENSDNNKLFSIADFPYLYTLHPSIWSKLYKAQFIKSIKFDETPNMNYQDGPFITEVYCKATKIIGLWEYLYHYRVDNEGASSGNRQKSQKLIKILDQWDLARDILKQYNKYELLKEEFYYQTSKSGIRFYRNILPKYRKIFFNRWKLFLKELADDNNFSYKYFDQRKKVFFNNIIENKYKEAQFDEYSSFNILGFPIIEKTKKNNRIKHRIFNIPYYIKMKKNKYIIKKYLFGIYKTKEENEYKKHYLFGVQIKITKSQKIDFSKYFENLQIQNLALATHSYLKAYKNIYYNKEIVILGCGPTLKHFQKINDKIYIGVNRAFKNTTTKLDYLFIQDQFPEGMTEADNYIGNNCKKFYGILSNWHCRHFNHCKRIPHNSADNAYLYYLESIISNNFPYDISTEPFGEFKSTIFSALQFALYTHPKKIYIVGCDCNNGYFYEATNHHKYPHLIEQWKKVQKHISEMYPDIKIISINPVGLKGLFHDVYTESYLKEHPEIKNVEIIKGSTEKEVVNV
ncbi:MAG: glycosyltransferase [Mollicutes bacterium]|nr:glycosyltransferase [Mollicutes bacterium]